MSIDMPIQNYFGIDQRDVRMLVANRKFFEGLELMPHMVHELDIHIRSVHSSLLIDALNLHYPTRDHTKLICYGKSMYTTFSGRNRVSYLNNVINAVRGNHHLKTLKVLGHNISIGTCESKNLARLLQDQRNTNLTTVSIGNVSITRDNGKFFRFDGSSARDTDTVSDEIASIAATLTESNLAEVLEFSSLFITERGWKILTDALQNSSCVLRKISLYEGSRDTFIINDDGAVALAGGLKKNCTLEIIRLCGNMSLSKRGWDALADALHDSNCRLRELDLRSLDARHQNPIVLNNDVAVALATGLAKNSSLEKISFFHTQSSITKPGWNFFAKALCDTSSINATYLSNHTVKWIGDQRPPSLRPNILFHLNRDGGGNKEIAAKKILKYHRRLDMSSLFEWDLKMLPHTVDWFESARPKIRNSPWLRGINLDAKKLDAIYQFVRSMPEIVEPVPRVPSACIIS